MALFNRFQTQCATHLPNQTAFLIGLSGGVDSVVLLHLFARTSFHVRAIYVHHGLSPNADDWAAFCEQYCKRLNIPFILQKVRVDSSNGVENGAREARYQAIQQQLKPNEVFATAHHLDDQAETFCSPSSEAVESKDYRRCKRSLFAKFYRFSTATHFY